MAKITVMKKVYWNAGGKIMAGKVKQILSDHAIVTAEGADYLVQKAVLKTEPIKTANTKARIITASSNGQIVEQ